MVADLPQLNNRIHECSCAASTLEGRGRGRGEKGGGEGEGREEIYLCRKKHTYIL